MQAEERLSIIEEQRKMDEERQKMRKEHAKRVKEEQKMILGKNNSRPKLSFSLKPTVSWFQYENRQKNRQTDFVNANKIQFKTISSY